MYGDIMMQDDYINSRLDPQIDYYDKTSVHCHREHDALSIFGIVLTASIPPLTLFTEVAPAIKFVVAIAGAAASILSSVLYLHKSKENWIEFRTICESLKSEREKYLHFVPPYGHELSDEERDAHFIAVCESMMQQEHTNWRLRVHDSNPSQSTHPSDGSTSS